MAKAKPVKKTEKKTEEQGVWRIKFAFWEWEIHGGGGLWSDYSAELNAHTEEEALAEVAPILDKYEVDGSPVLSYRKVLPKRKAQTSRYR